MRTSEHRLPRQNTCTQVASTRGAVYGSGKHHRKPRTLSTTEPIHALSAMSQLTGGGASVTHGGYTLSRSMGSRLIHAAPNPLVIAWRWRYEFALVAGLSAGLA